MVDYEMAQVVMGEQKLWNFEGLSAGRVKTYFCVRELKMIVSIDVCDLHRLELGRTPSDALISDDNEINDFMAKFNITCNLPFKDRGIFTGVEFRDQKYQEACLCTANLAYSYRAVLFFSDHKFLLRTVCLLIQILNQLVY